MFRKIADAGAVQRAQLTQLTMTIDGKAVSAEPGETVAAVLLREQNTWNRTTPVLGSPRAPFCMMGVCFDCLAVVDGVASTQCCLVTVREGMCVERQLGRRSIQP